MMKFQNGRPQQWSASGAGAPWGQRAAILPRLGSTRVNGTIPQNFVDLVEKAFDEGGTRPHRPGV